MGDGSRIHLDIHHRCRRGGVVIVRFARTNYFRAWPWHSVGCSVGCSETRRSSRDLRAGLGSVVDFIGLPNFPVFNVADMAITCSAVAMIILAWRGIPLSESEPDGSSSGDSRSEESASQAQMSTDEPMHEDELRHDDTPAAGSGP